MFFERANMLKRVHFHGNCKYLYLFPSYFLFTILVFWKLMLSYYKLFSFCAILVSLPFFKKNKKEIYL